MLCGAECLNSGSVLVGLLRPAAEPTVFEIRLSPREIEDAVGRVREFLGA